MSKKIIAVLFATLILFNAGAVVLGDESPVISVGEVKAKKGCAVEVPIMLENNMGFTAISIEINFDREILTLVSVKSSVKNPKISMTSQHYYDEPYVIKWLSSKEKSVFNGELARLEFEVADNAEIGDYPITIDYFKGPAGNWTDGVDTNFYKDEGGYAFPLGLQYKSSVVNVIGAKTVTVNAGGKSAVGEIEVIKGIVIVSLYNDEHKQIDIKIFDAADDAFEYVSNKTAKYAGIMCWEKTDKTLTPILDKLELILQ